MRPASLLRAWKTRPWMQRLSGLTFDPSIQRLSCLNNDYRARRLPPSTVFQIDAAIPASYPGSGQTWFNVCKRPADGLAQSAYDFWLGRDGLSGTDEPTFSANKFTLDGGDFAEVKNTQDFFRNQIRTDLTNSWWVASAYMIASAASTQSILGTTNGATTHGWRFDHNTTPNLRFTRTDGTVNQANNLHSLSGKIGIPLLHVFTWNNESQSYKSALNSRIFTVSATAANLPSTQQNPGKFNFGSANHGTQKLLNGSELYGMAMGIGSVNDKMLSSIVDYYNSLHKRTYA